jgi:hypothetical protein
MGQVDMSDADQTNAPHTSRLFTSRKFPIHYLVIPKCGCTFVKNFLWTLENGDAHANGLRIHDDDSRFMRASELGLTVEQIIAREHAFTVVRNPIDRFYSLYSDKVIGDGHKRFVPLRHVLQENHGLDVNATSVDAHRANCEILIDWLGRNLDAPQEIENDSHWTPQIYRQNLMKVFRLKTLMLNKLDEQLPLLLQDIVPETKSIMQGNERNKTSTGVSRDDVLDKELRSKINEVYSGDRKLFNTTRKLWQDRDPATGTDIPRYGDTLSA